MGRCGLDWSGSGYEQLESSCELGIEPSGSLKCVTISLPAVISEEATARSSTLTEHPVLVKVYTPRIAFPRQTTQDDSC
jgi:hypothetical protein